MWTRQFWQQVAERALKTAGQFGIVALGGNFSNAWDLDPRQLGGAIVAGALVSVLTSIASLPFGPSDTPSVVKS